jgi:YegS/Rv2252/BmrU family lipid kinase
MKYCLIYNPTAKQGRSKKDFDRIVSILKERNVNFKYVLTTGKDEAINLSNSIAKHDSDVVVPVGGDGTICEAITGLMSQPRETRPLMGVLHIGTSPDFNRYHQIPYNVEEAIEVLLKGKTRCIDIGKVTHRDLDRRKDITSYFGSSVNIGMGPSIASKSNGRYRKYLGDFLGTLSSTLVSLARFNPINLRLKVDGQDADAESIFNLTVGKDPYLASGMRVPVEMAEDNGNMYLLSIQGQHKIPLMANLWRLYAGNILDYSGAKLRYCKEIEVQGSKDESLEFDGDVRGYLPAKIEVIPKALEILVK